MSLGDGGQTQKKNTEDSYNSRLTLYDPTTTKYLKFKFWAGKVVVSINMGESNQQQGFKYNETIASFLTPIKAKIMAEELTKFKADPKSNPVGVVSGGDPSTCLTFLRDGDNVVVDIRKVDGKGKVTASDRFTIQKDYHYSVSYKNYDKLDFTKNFYNDIELQAIIDIFNNFYNACNGANAYSVLDMSRFNYSRLRSNTEAIMDKLGIQRYSSRGSGNSFFNNSNNDSAFGSGSTSNHMEDIDDML